MKNSNTNLVSSATVYPKNGYAEFTTLFRIKFSNPNKDIEYNIIDWRDVLALEMRMDACVSMLFRNRDNVISSNEHEVVFVKKNGIAHTFRHASFNAMEQMIGAIKGGHWDFIRDFPAGVAQLRKALYWIDAEDKKDHGSFGFGQLISCLEELEACGRYHSNHA